MQITVSNLRRNASENGELPKSQSSALAGGILADFTRYPERVRGDRRPQGLDDSHRPKNNGRNHRRRLFEVLVTYLLSIGTAQIMRVIIQVGLAAMAAALLLSGCQQSDDEAATPATGTTQATWPASLPVFGDGLPNSGDACRRVGESANYILGANYYPPDSRNYRLNLQYNYVDNSPGSSAFGYYTAGEKGNTISAAASVFF